MMILICTRGLGGVKSLMLGNVSHVVLHHSDRAVLVASLPESGSAAPPLGPARPDHSRHT
jgi:hypothetical protein